MTRYAAILSRELDAYLAFWAEAREGEAPVTHDDPVTREALEAGRGRGRAWAAHLEEAVGPEDVPSPLSGEWADEPTPDDVLAYIAKTHGDETVDEHTNEVLDAYEAGFFQGYREVAQERGLWDES